MRVGAAVLVALGMSAGPAAAADLHSCLASVGFERSSTLAVQCAAVIHSGTICRLEQPCDQLVLGIRQGCAALANNDPLSLPPFCGNDLPAR
jgi:hypothetical protein